MAYATARQFANNYGLDATLRLLKSLEPGASADVAVLDVLLGGTDPSGPDEDALALGLDRLARHLDKQSSFADGYLGKTVALPLDAAVVAANNLVDIICDLTRYSMATRPGMRTKRIEDDRNDALTWLQQISSGTAVLLGLAEGESTTQVAVSARDPQYTDPFWDTY